MTATAEIRTYTCPHCGYVKPCRCNIMDDQAEQYSSYEPRPIHDCEGHRMTKAADQKFDMAGAIALRDRIIDGLLEAMGTQGMTMDTFRTENRQPAKIEKQGNVYDVRRKCAAMGS